VGYAGSGKTFLATKIANRYSIPHLQLDRLFLRHGGGSVAPEDTKTKEQIRALMRAEISQFLDKNEHWVSDGTYTHVQSEIAEQADHVLYLDIPLWRRQLNHLKRVVLRIDRHPEVSFWQDLYFTYDMIRRTRMGHVYFQQLQTDHSDKLIILRSRRAVQKYLDHLSWL